MITTYTPRITTYTHRIATHTHRLQHTQEQNTGTILQVNPTAVDMTPLTKSLPSDLFVHFINDGLNLLKAQALFSPLQCLLQGSVIPISQVGFHIAQLSVLAHKCLDSGIGVSTSSTLIDLLQSSSNWRWERSGSGRVVGGCGSGVGGRGSGVGGRGSGVGGRGSGGVVEDVGMTNVVVGVFVKVGMVVEVARR